MARKQLVLAIFASESAAEAAAEAPMQWDGARDDQVLAESPQAGEANCDRG